MEDKMILKEKQLAQVSGGTGDTDGGYNTGGRKCPTCGSKRVSFVGEVGDMGKFECEDCGVRYDWTFRL